MSERSAAPWVFDIETLINESQPDSILAIGRDATVVVDAYIEQKSFLKKQCHVTRITDPMSVFEAELERHDTGIVVAALENMRKSAALHLLARLRDVLTRQFCTVVPVEGDWPDHVSKWELNEMLGLGMSLLNQYDMDRGVVAIFKYDIATYKKTPDWLNPDNWANPELWNKYRW